jgi:hypothetical protein
MRRASLAKAGLALFGIVLAYVLLLRYPRPLFAYATSLDNFALRSDRPFSPAAGRQVLTLAQAKLIRSPLYSSQQRYSIFICNARWRQMIFFNKDYDVGGVAPYPLSNNVFLRDADIDHDRLISPHGIASVALEPWTTLSPMS